MFGQQLDQLAVAAGQWNGVVKSETNRRLAQFFLSFAIEQDERGSSINTIECPLDLSGVEAFAVGTDHDGVNWLACGGCSDFRDRVAQA